MQKRTEFRSSIFLLIIILFTAAVIACRIGAGATQVPEMQAPEPQPPDEPADQVPTEAAAAQIEPVEIPQDAAGGVLFQDDFQDGQPDNWQVVSSWYVQQSGDIYVFGGAGKGGALLPVGANWSGYAFESDAVLNDGSLNLSFDYTEAGRYLVLLREDGLFLVKESPVDDYKVLAHTGPVPAGEWHRIAIKTKDGRIQVLVDDQLWIDFNDLEPISRGTIAVGTMDGSMASVDNVLVSQITSPLQSAPIAAPPPMVDAQTAEDAFEGISSVLPAGDGQAAPDEGQQAPEEGQKAPPQEPPPDEGDEPPQPVPIEQGQTGSDVSILDVELPLEIMQGTPFNVTITMHNAGPDIAASYTVVWLPEGTFIGCSWDIYDHLIGVDHRVTVSCDYAGYPNEGMFTWIVRADPEDTLNDFDPNGNERSNKIRVRPK